MNIRIYIAPTLSAMTTFLKKLPSQRKNLIFCEDRFTLEAERAIVEAQGTAFDTRVTTFARFLNDGVPRKVLTKQGSVLVIGGIAARLGESLHCFGKNPAGCAAELYETIAQLRAAMVTPEMLDEASEQAEPLLAAKLKDIAAVYRGYVEFLKGGYLDESGVLALLPNAVYRRNLRDTDIWFVGFESFTKQAAEGIRAAISAGGSVNAVLLGGKESMYTNEAVADFEKYAGYAGAVCERVYLPSDAVPAAEVLRKALFNPVYVPPVSTDAVHIFEAADVEDELRLIAAQIRAEVYSGARYRDISLYLSDVAGYSVPLAKIFGEYNIPYYADVKKNLAQHPLSCFILSWFSMLAEGFDPEDCDRFVSSEFFDRNRENRDTYRNYLYEYAGFRGGCKREIKQNTGLNEQTEKTFSAMRARLVQSFEGASSSMTGGAYVRLVRRLLQLFDCETVQEEIAERLAQAGMRAESEFFSRGYENILRVLDEEEALADDTKMHAEEFCAILSESLTALEISLIPQYLDAVFVGDISQSRKPACKVVFAAGMTDAVPGCGEDIALISDKDIDRLRTLRVEITPKIREINARTRENVASALCGFTEKLYLSYPLSVGGEEKKRSEVFSAICRSLQHNEKQLAPFNRAALERCERDNPAAYRRYLSNVASEYFPAVRELLIRADAFRQGKKDFVAHTGLYAVLKDHDCAPNAQLYPKPPAPPFIREAPKLLLRANKILSPGLIEKYFDCPYSTFAQKGLRLNEHRKASVQVTDTGNFIHELLRRFAMNVSQISDISECEPFILREANALMKEPPYCYMHDTQVGEIASEMLCAETVTACKKVYETLANSLFRVEGAEVAFGERDSELPALPLTDDRNGFAVKGKIDRVDRSDGYVRVIDYKTGHFDADALAYYTGRRLQLELYLTAASVGAKPAGAYYFSAKREFSKSDKPEPYMQGFTLNADNMVRRSDIHADNADENRYIGFGGKRTKNRLLEEQPFNAFLRYSKLAASRCAEEIAEGCIAASPYKDECVYCPYGSLCGFEGTERSERSITEKEVAQIVIAEEEKHGKA